MLEKIKNIVENEIIKNIKDDKVYFKVKNSDETDEIEILYKIDSSYDSLEKRNEIFDEINTLVCKNFNRSELDNILIIYDYFDEIAEVNILNSEKLSEYINGYEYINGREYINEYIDLSESNYKINENVLSKYMDYRKEGLDWAA